MPTAVIGSNFGDEGKGLITDFLCSQLTGEKVVVRANGGAQAGHTVVPPMGERHIFSHFSAGTFAGASTYLAKHFVCNPILFWTEFKQLASLNSVPKVAIDPRCLITTPYDMMINQALEDSRGMSRHGSVGIGFGETIGRNSYPAFQLWRSDLGNRILTVEKVKRIRDSWYPMRSNQLKLVRPHKDDPRLSDEMLATFIEECCAFHASTQIAGAEFLRNKSIIFEGAQGLGLDMTHGTVPHVTRSNTGLTNIIPLVKALSLNLNVIYVTRPYITRHGAGPLLRQYTPDPPIVDETNTENSYQGKIRFGHLDIGELKNRVQKDLSDNGNPPHRFAISCCDQVFSELRKTVIDALNPLHLSFGPKRTDVI